MGETKSPSAAGREQWPRTFLAWAVDSRFLEAPCEQWCAFWAKDGGALALSGADVEPARFTMEVESLPMWSEVQAVRLRHAELASEPLIGALARYLDRPSQTTALLVEFTGDLGEKKAPAAWRGILKKVESRALSPRSGRDYIQRRLREEGLSMSAQTVGVLEEWAAGDVALLVSALDLLAVYRHGDKTIGPQDLEALLGAGGTPSQWDLQDAFLRGEVGKVETLLGGLRRNPDAAPLAVLGMLAKQMRSLLLLHGHIAAGRSRSEIGYKDLDFKNPFPAKKLMETAGRWPEPRARAALGSLYRIDLDLKGHPGDPWGILERGLLAMMRA